MSIFRRTSPAFAHHVSFSNRGFPTQLQAVFAQVHADRGFTSHTWVTVRAAGDLVKPGEKASAVVRSTLPGAKGGVMEYYNRDQLRGDLHATGGGKFFSPRDQQLLDRVAASEGFASFTWHHAHSARKLAVVKDGQAATAIPVFNRGRDALETASYFNEDQLLPPPTATHVYASGTPVSAMMQHQLDRVARERGYASTVWHTGPKAAAVKAGEEPAHSFKTNDYAVLTFNSEQLVGVSGSEAAVAA